VIFEKIGTAIVDTDLQALRIEVEGKTYLIGLKDLDNVMLSRGIVQVFRLALVAKAVPEENGKAAKGDSQP
jgi:hypothetical protein